MRIEEIFGSTESIDLISRRGDVVDLVMIINGYVGESPEELSALERKLRYYNSWADSAEFAALYGEAEVSVAVTFTEPPSDTVISRLSDCCKKMSGAGRELRVTIGGLPLLFIGD